MTEVQEAEPGLVEYVNSLTKNILLYTKFDLGLALTISEMVHNQIFFNCIEAGLKQEYVLRPKKKEKQERMKK